jgi:hypothetical protein
MMSDLGQEFKDIVIVRAFKPVPIKEPKGYYCLPILLSDRPTRKWMEVFLSAYNACERYPGERILQHHQMPARRAFTSPFSEDKGDLALKLLKGEPEPLKYDLDRFLLFHFSIEGPGPHPNTQESLKKSCEEANKEYRRHLAAEGKKHEQEDHEHKAAEEKQDSKDRRAEELTKGWFEG